MAFFHRSRNSPNMVSSQINSPHSEHTNIPFSLFTTSLCLVLLHLKLYSDNCLMSHNQLFTYPFRHLLSVFYGPRTMLDTGRGGGKDKNGIISIFRKLILKTCREYSFRKLTGFVELGLDKILALKIFPLWASEDHHEQWEGPGYRITWTRHSPGCQPISSPVTMMPLGVLLLL